MLCVDTVRDVVLERSFQLRGVDPIARRASIASRSAPEPVTAGDAVNLREGSGVLPKAGVREEMEPWKPVRGSDWP